MKKKRRAKPTIHGIRRLMFVATRSLQCRQFAVRRGDIFPGWWSTFAVRHLAKPYDTPFETPWSQNAFAEAVDIMTMEGQRRLAKIRGEKPPTRMPIFGG